jgi:hypothetical protein
MSGGGTSGTVTVAVDHEAFSGNLIPSSNNTFQLGSATHVWKDVFVGPGSLYVNGQQVLSDNSGTIQVSADNNQNISVLTTGSGDVELTAGGSIQLKSDVVLSAGKTISQVGGLVQASNINMNSNSINNLDDPVAAQDGATKAYVDAQILTKDNTDEITEGSNNLYYTDARADARITNALKDEDDMSSDSATHVPSQQSVKAYVDGQTTDETAEGSTNLYFTDARVMTSLATVDAHIVPTTDVTYDLGSTSKQWRDIYVGPGSLYVNGQQVVSDNSGTITVSADADQNVSVQTSGSGDVELNPTGTGTIQLKGGVQVTAGKNVSSSDGNAISFANSIDVDAIESRSTDTNLVLSANGTGVVAVSDSLTVSGNLTVSGTTTTVNSETISLADNIIALNSNFTSGSPTEDTGISVTRGGSASKTLIWDETNDKWTVGSETFVAGTFEGNLTGNVTGNVTGSSGSTTGNAATATLATNAQGLTGTPNISVGTIASGAITITNATNSGGTARNMYQSTSAPTGSDGAVGDMWILYS